VLVEERIAQIFRLVIRVLLHFHTIVQLSSADDESLRDVCWHPSSCAISSSEHVSRSFPHCMVNELGVDAVAHYCDRVLPAQAIGMTRQQWTTSTVWPSTGSIG
jgi:hypothetical protein